MNIPDTHTELLERTFKHGTRVTNCVTHISMPIDKRPDNCHLCLTDLRNHMNFCLGVNEYLNKWVEDAKAALRAR